MSNQDIIAISSLISATLISIVSLVSSFILQRDAKKIRELEREKKSLTKDLLKALQAIKGYQAIETEFASRQGISVAVYRKQIRKNNREFFHSDFLSPKNIDEKIKEIEK